MYALSVTSLTLIQVGNYEIATTQSHEAIALADEKGAPFWRAFGMMNRGCALALQGKASDAVPMITSGGCTAISVRPATAQWALFLRNHDELDLGRLTKAQREKVFAAFGPEQGMQLYERGIRRRLAPMLGGDQRRLELAYSLMFTLPGTPVIRYGDELGMGDDLSLPERNAARTPMQWTDEANGGFSKCDRPRVPVIADGPYGYTHINAAVERRHSDSLLNWTERIIRMRKELPEVGWGDFVVLKLGDPAVLALRYEWRNNFVVIVHNLASQPREISLNVGLGSEGQPSGQSSRRRAQPGASVRQTPDCARGLWLSLVPSGWTQSSPGSHRSSSTEYRPNQKLREQQTRGHSDEDVSVVVWVGNFQSYLIRTCSLPFLHGSNVIRRGVVKP